MPEPEFEQVNIHLQGLCLSLFIVSLPPSLRATDLKSGVCTHHCLDNFVDALSLETWFKHLCIPECQPLCVG